MTSIAPGSVKLFTIIITSVFASVTPLLTRLVKRLLGLIKKLALDIVHKVT
ncbi:ankyrin repeat-containing protein [Corchorus capsularis]|uniref:Ankyrin repeat-containing protein n=1 Tax=Corchorus capsularis TaxID=210143 RepID=A0A1R3JJ69_COCAP|nr:ankyrin repeat-containing protein [Corchorus capsularis]